jgi:hypothetical protein
VKILQLARSRVLLWARERGHDVPFEVSKVVGVPLQGRCATAPRCPGQAEEDEGEDGWIDPDESAARDCPYAFSTRGDCLSHRNQRALEAALFRPGEVVLTRRLLEALGFEVESEPIEPLAGSRVLIAHGAIGPSCQVRLLRSPGAGQIVLVRDVAQVPRGERSTLGGHR